MKIVLCAIAVILLLPSQASASDLTVAPLYSSSDLSAFTKWADMISRKQDDAKFDAFASSIAQYPFIKRITAANDYFNSLPYISDRNNWGVDDYWETPHELMMRGGDCEDYAIAKYMALAQTGILTKDMRLLTVYDNERHGELHTVLIVKGGGDSYVLDSQERRVFPLGKVHRYEPIYSLNEHGFSGYKK